MRLSHSWKAAVAAGLFAFTGAAPVAAQETSLRAVIHTDNASSPFRVAFDALAQNVNEQGAGKVRIGHVIGPETIPANQQPRALKDGLADIVAAPPSYFENLVQGLGGLSAARVTTRQMRQNGTFEAANAMLKGPANARMIGL